MSWILVRAVGLLDHTPNPVVATAPVSMDWDSVSSSSTVAQTGQAQRLSLAATASDLPSTATLTALQNAVPVYPMHGWMGARQESVNHCLGRLLFALTSSRAPSHPLPPPTNYRCDVLATVLVHGGRHVSARCAAQPNPGGGGQVEKGVCLLAGARTTDTSAPASERERREHRREKKPDEALRCCLVMDGLDSNGGHRHTPSQPGSRRDRGWGQHFISTSPTRACAKGD